MIVAFWICVAITVLLLVYKIGAVLQKKLDKAYQYLWVESMIVDEFLLLRWSAKRLAAYCKKQNVTVTYVRHQPRPVTYQRPATEDEVIQWVGARLVVSMLGLEGQKRMKARVQAAREMVLSEVVPYKVGDMQRIVEEIWGRGK